MSGSAADLIRVALARAAAEPPRPGAGVVALGWATVDLGRAAAERARDLGRPDGVFRAAEASLVLGARCLVADAVLAGGRSLVLLEPATEGRLASMLARLDEGPWVAWFASGSDDDVDPSAGARGTGPFGPERLVAGGPAHGPFRLLVGPPAGTIRA